jgi:hypothetical protein
MLRLLGISASDKDKKIYLASVPKETKEAIPKVILETFLLQGLENNEVCVLLESFFSSVDPVQLEKRDNTDIRVNCKSFIPDHAYSLLVGRRYLQEAYTLGKDALSKNNVPLMQKSNLYKTQGYSHLRRHSESVNLKVALEELIRNSMPLQALSICLEAIENIESFRKIESSIGILKGNH